MSDNKQKDLTLSKEEIKRFVDELLLDKDINIGLLPDAIERALYENILTILMKLVQHSLDDLKISFMGHNLKISLEPPVREADENSEKMDVDV